MSSSIELAECIKTAESSKRPLDTPHYPDKKRSKIDSELLIEIRDIVKASLHSLTHELLPNLIKSQNTFFKKYEVWPISPYFFVKFNINSGQLTHIG